MHVDRLVTSAADSHVHIRIHPKVGDHIVEGAPLASVWPIDPRDEPARDTALTRSIAREIRIGFERTLEQDPGFGLRQLVDAA